MTTFQDYLKLLDRRMERLHEEHSMNAPTLIIKTELNLIKDACDQLIKILK